MGGRLKMGTPHPTNDNLIFWSYNKNRPNGEDWVTKDKFKERKGYDDFWSVYYIPKENYYGATNRIKKRIKEHAAKGKNILDWRIVKKFNTKREALDYEMKMQISKKANGYIFTDSWREKQVEKLKIFGEEKIYSKKRKKVICLDTNEVFDSVVECERKIGGARSGNLSRHLKGNPLYKDFKGLKFKYYEPENGTN